MNDVMLICAIWAANHIELNWAGVRSMWIETWLVVDDSEVPAWLSVQPNPGPTFKAEALVPFDVVWDREPALCRGALGAAITEEP